MKRQPAVRMYRGPTRQRAEELVRCPVKMVAVHVSFHISDDRRYDLSNVLAR
jgi:hypothetical protein